MPLQGVVLDKAVDFILGMGREVGSEMVAEFASNWLLGQKGQDQNLRQQVMDMIRDGKKDELKSLIQANQLGIGLGDEQILEEDLAGALITNQIDNLTTLSHFFYVVLSERERTKYRRAHILQGDPKIRMRTLGVLHRLPNDDARRQLIGAVGKLDRTFLEKAEDWLQASGPRERAEYHQAVRESRNARDNALRARPNFFRRTLQRFGF
jgi:hypothetical protein